MSDVVIRVEHLSKYYRLGLIGGGTLREDLHRWWADVRGKPDPQAEIGAPDRASGKGGELWALRDVSFDVKQGEIVGIVGRNGAGKSTLLKILSRITAPTAGKVKIRGRVGSLLEVGTGFHPELTGRENIFLNGAILGMRTREIASKLDEIVAFAELAQFIDTPVKRYSSGMYVRLAFAVAAHLDPEILVVDEVLAVGDVEFQKKCLGKMRDVSAQGHRTVLFVSHNMAAVASLCNGAILLKEGTISASGGVAEVIGAYTNPRAQSEDNAERVWNDIRVAPGNDQLRIQRVAILSARGELPAVLQMGDEFCVEVEYWNLVARDTVFVNLVFRSNDGTPIFESITSEDPSWHSPAHPTGLYRTRCVVPPKLVNEGRFTIQLIFFSGRLEQIFDFAEATTVTIHDTGSRGGLAYYGRFLGNTHPQLDWNTILVSEGLGERVGSSAS